MTTSLDHLLPAVDEAIRCAEHARRIEVDPGGTALRADRIVLVAAPLPWPKPALDHPAVRPLVDVLNQAGVPTRVLTFVPDGPILPDGPVSDGATPNGATPDGATIVAYERDGASAVERRYRPTTPEGALTVARALATGAFDVAREHLVAEHRPARPAVLICTQGSHDVCCGAEGTRLAGELQARSDATAAAAGGAVPQLFRVSHTGGHRFAPTAMTLPDGRMWAGLTVERLAAIQHRTGDVGELASGCRGWWGAETGPAQVAERAVLAARGWSLDGCDRRVEVVHRPAGPILATVTVIPEGSRAGEGEERWEVELEAGRLVPTIACRQPGGLPAKSAQEYDVLAVRRAG